MSTRKSYYRINRNQICFVRFILEAYEGIALMRTINAKKGIIEIMTAPGCENDVDEILHSLSQSIKMIPINGEQYNDE
ncbi:hypothetical protein MHK_010858 [Candidatus Magnetomorum sp. HK-1]|nr:hypothetical protein MHK_010858 [Candidatus Magnetomorum sp. HK-1]